MKYIVSQLALKKITTRKRYLNMSFHFPEMFHSYFIKGKHF